MLNIIVLALCAVVFVVACLFNLRVGWVNARRGYLRANRMAVYGVSGCIAAVAFAVVMVVKRSVWLYPELTHIDGAIDETVGAGIIAIGILFVIAVVVVGGAVALLGQLAEGLKLSECGNRRLKAIEANAKH